MKAVISVGGVDVNVEVVTPRVLGLPHLSRLEEVFDRALKLGLQFCPPEIGPAMLSAVVSGKIEVTGLIKIASQPKAVRPIVFGFDTIVPTAMYFGARCETPQNFDDQWVFLSPRAEVSEYEFRTVKKFAEDAMHCLFRFSEEVPQWQSKPIEEYSRYADGPDKCSECGEAEYNHTPDCVIGKRYKNSEALTTGWYYWEKGRK